MGRASGGKGSTDQDASQNPRQPYIPENRRLNGILSLSTGDRREESRNIPPNITLAIYAISMYSAKYLDWGSWREI